MIESPEKADAPELADVNSPAPEPPPIRVDGPATQRLRQAVADYIASLPPASREITSEYFGRVLPNAVVLAPPENQ